MAVALKSYPLFAIKPWQNRNFIFSVLPKNQCTLNGVLNSYSETLHNEKAANDLIDAVEKAIMERLPIAESFEPFRSVKERQYKYYRIYVKNFVIYYVVIDGIDSKKIMEVRRFLYNKQDREQLI